jgi:hypothetical protein
VTALTITPAEMVREAHAVLHVAFAAQWPEGETALKAVVLAACDLSDALEVYRELDSDGLHWEYVYPHLLDQADPDEAALRKAAEEAEAMAEDLIKVIAAHCGTEDEKKHAAGDM